MPLSPGQIINNRYRIVKLLGQGGFGAVYKAWDTNLERSVAFKENLDTSPEAQRQFKREALMLADLSHPNLPRVTDHFSLSGQGQYLVMDFVEGQDLEELLAAHGGPLPEMQVLAWAEQVCEALTYLHTQNPPIIHRDIKPANIKITPAGKAMLVDFGIAKTYNPNLKTTMGARAVTPGYSPPEQYGQGTTDARSDIYSLGATLYTLLTGHQPVESVQRTLGARLAPPRALNPAISLWTENAILHALEVLPDKRYQSAKQFKAALVPPASPVITPPQQPSVSHSSLAPSRTSAPAKLPASPFPWRLLLGVMLPLALLFGVSLIAKWGWERGYILGTATPTERATAAISTHTPWPSTTPLPPTPSDMPLPPNVTNTVEPSPFTPAPTLDPGSFQISDKDGMKLLYVPAGEFLMGSTDSDSQASSYEKPQHTVYLDAFWIDQTEVTNAMYRQCVQAGLCQAPSNTTDYADTQFGNYPVVYVSWNDAQAYCQWAGRKLPTEAQWEKAARGADGRTYPWGEGVSCDKANYSGCPRYMTAVGSYPSGASPYGALDMAGNVWEWVADWFGENYYTSSPSNNPTGPDSGQDLILRGGSWMLDAQAMRAAYRLRGSPDYRIGSSGFRCSR